jgi:hypothetical protein
MHLPLSLECFLGDCVLLRELEFLFGLIKFFLEILTLIPESLQIFLLLIEQLMHIVSFS